ncbi:hypothetical protein Agabi119p4_8718 [Agaricus bisporus var. burnettii]|uniref:Uncharacterized protein n=1 Tax=Agaricus bisporus var. burnettii TaxID=192524 RepID=A0A8H7C4W5_AGABI|nr:hypothetical protein Agabi119p4_8718 [Agaricus bisporus var. burnettii]
MAKQPLHPQAQRIRTIIWSAPLMVGCGYVLYRRWVLGEEQRKFGDNTKLEQPSSVALEEPRMKPSQN